MQNKENTTSYMQNEENTKENNNCGKVASDGFTLRSIAVLGQLAIGSSALDLSSAQQTYFFSAQLFWVSFESADLPAALSAAFITPPLTTLNSL